MAKVKQVSVKANINIKHDGKVHMADSKFKLEEKAAKALEEKGYLEILEEVEIKESKKPGKSNDKDANTDGDGAGADNDTTDGEDEDSKEE